MNDLDLYFYKNLLVGILAGRNPKKSIEIKPVKIKELPEECQSILESKAPLGLLHEKRAELWLINCGAHNFAVATYDDDEQDYHCDYIAYKDMTLEKDGNFRYFWRLIHENTGG